MTVEKMHRASRIMIELDNAEANIEVLCEALKNLDRDAKQEGYSVQVSVGTSRTFWAGPDFVRTLLDKELGEARARVTALKAEFEAL